MSESTEALTVTEAEELTRLETIIARGLETFMEVGCALVRIRDAKLYRKDYKTFEDYCRDRWVMSANYAYRLIDAAAVCINIQKLAPGQVFALPQNEKIIRSLVSLEPEQQSAVWQEACTKANGHPTAEQVSQVAKEIVPPEQRTKRKRKSDAEKLAERIGMRIAFDGSLVAKDFTDDQRREAIAQMNALRAEERAKHPVNYDQPASSAPGPEAAKPKPAKPKPSSIEARFKHARPALFKVLRKYFRKDEFARVCELFIQAINEQKQ